MGDPVAELLCSVQLPLENIEFAIARYLEAHGVRLDTQTRCLLAQVRDGVGRVAASSRSLTAPDEPQAANRQVEREAEVA